MNYTVLFSLLSSIFFTLAAGLLVARRKNALLSGSVFTPLLFSILLYDFICLSNILEHSGITGYFDPIGDIAEVVFILMFLFFVNNWRKDRSESRFRELFKFSPTSLAEIDSDGRIIQTNDILRKKFKEFFGRPLDDLPTINDLWEMAYPDLKQRESEIQSWKEDIKRAYQTGQPINPKEKSITCRDGSTLTIIVDASIIGRNYLFSLVDITERRRAEETILRNETMQRKMVANIGDVIVIIDKDGINRYKSPNMEKLFGWKPEDVVGKSTWENIHPEDLESTQHFIARLLQTPNAVGTFECRYKHKDGVYRWIEFTGSNLSDDKDIQGILGNYHDITERKQAEQSLRESETRFKALHNASFGGIAIHDKGIILECNKGLSDISGYSEDELIGMDGLLLIAEKSRDQVMKNIVSGYEKPYEAWA